MNTNELKYACKYCHCSYKYKILLKSHIAEEHKAYQCSVCHERCLNIEDMRFHVKNVHLSNLTCPLCDKIFANRDLYMNHTKEHLTASVEGPSKVKKEMYHKECLGQTTGLRQERKERSIVEAQDSGNAVTLAGGGDTLLEVQEPPQCDKCGLYYDYKSQLREHQKTHKVPLYKCGICRFESSTRECVLEHINSEHKSFQDNFKELSCFFAYTCK